jgi:isoleucyl-tRNA synthetase
VTAHVLIITCYFCRYVKDADKEIIASIKAAGRLVDHASLNHSYPFCWRSDTPLIYRAVPSWFVKVCGLYSFVLLFSIHQDVMLECAAGVHIW